MKYNNEITINKKKISITSETYFIADIASNHNGDIEKAKDLIYKAKEAGADAVKFQHFKAQSIVSDYGFKNLGNQVSHQATWKESVFAIYKKYECNREWTTDLAKTAQKAHIDFFTAPYDYEAIDLLDKDIPAYKIGSGDITWIHFIETVAQKSKPVILSTGASNIEDVQRAVNAITAYNKDIILLQCNTNYTGNISNFKHVNLNVLKTFSTMYPNMILGLSDHTPLHSAVLGAIALGARVIEKHFTDNNNQTGPDHKFSLNPITWKEMIERSRELEMALGDGIKRVEENENETVIIQRRSIRLKRNIKPAEIIKASDIEFLRPAPLNSLEPFHEKNIIGKKTSVAKKCGDTLLMSDLKAIE